MTHRETKKIFTFFFLLMFPGIWAWLKSALNNAIHLKSSARQSSLKVTKHSQGRNTMHPLEIYPVTYAVVAALKSHKRVGYCPW